VARLRKRRSVGNNTQPGTCGRERQGLPQHSLGDSQEWDSFQANPPACEHEAEVSFSEPGDGATTSLG
jgi:hypothetical protein